MAAAHLPFTGQSGLHVAYDIKFDIPGLNEDIHYKKKNKKQVKTKLRFFSPQCATLLKKESWKQPQYQTWGNFFFLRNQDLVSINAHLKASKYDLNE